MYTDLYKPYRHQGSIANEMENLLQKHFGGPINTGPLAGEWLPPATLTERVDSLVVTAELPGMEISDIELSITGDVLTIKGEKKDDTKEGHDHSHFGERFYGSFHHSVDLPRRVQIEKIEARFYQDVLTVVLPKMAEPVDHPITIKRGEFTRLLDPARDRQRQKQHLPKFNGLYPII
ncbi:MAG: Hsp20/alpha crystallin family protein [bacterium]